MKVAGKAVKNMIKTEKIEKQFQEKCEMAEEVGKFGGEIIAKNIPNMSKKQILDSLPTEWKYTENNGFVHVRDTSGNI
ncbi:hypothetical protein [Bacillus atrophaeus]|uniref:hypothetical protein n=2 Tax=Bacillus atrophaeus TaxID=1452 RepID=UPI0022804F6C|nr:hypothetical protein [Bacillus atrophaeus]MCY8857121.1 hypothetical protein [Bacillus atrophaeus]MED1015438.1 hypothetical protein [Bacillus atrophaeus]MED1029785.1 hypothetical protein [Bacillus atrophaeus]MED1117501.1 hypothetical protein [Bacillus atrophaeus]